MSILYFLYFKGLISFEFNPTEHGLGYRTQLVTYLQNEILNH
jgi:hypothetical protein